MEIRAPRLVSVGPSLLLPLGSKVGSSTLRAVSCAASWGRSRVPIYAKAQMRAQIDALAMQGAPSASSLIELDGKIEFQTQRVQSEVHAEQRQLAFTEVPDTVALIAGCTKTH